MTRSGYDVKTKARNTRKVCAKCGKKSWVKPRERTCWRSGRSASGFRTGYACGGALSKIATKPAPKKTALADADYVALQRAIAKRKRDFSAAKLEKWKAARIRVAVAISKWEQRVERWTKQAAKTDAEILARRDRIKVAQQVNRVRRRLLGKGLPKTSDPLAFMEAAK